MKRISALLALTLAACSSTPTVSKRRAFTPPATAPSHAGLLGAIPPELFRGDIAGSDLVRTGGGEYLDFVFLRDGERDAVPTRVALYTKAPDGSLRLALVAPTPFGPGDCAKGECRARIAPMPNGFQISRESLLPDRLRSDYRFVRDGKDLRLIGKGFQARQPGAKLAGRAATCSLYVDFEKGRAVRRVGGKSRMDDGSPGAAPLLARDAVRFETKTANDLCAL